MDDQTPAGKSGLTEKELLKLMETSNSVMDAALEIVAPGRSKMTVSELAEAALACKAAGQKLEHAVMSYTNPVDESPETE